MRTLPLLSDYSLSSASRLRCNTNVESGYNKLRWQHASQIVDGVYSTWSNCVDLLCKRAYAVVDGRLWIEHWIHDKVTAQRSCVTKLCIQCKINLYHSRVLLFFIRVFYVLCSSFFRRFYYLSSILFYYEYATVLISAQCSTWTSNWSSIACKTVAVKSCYLPQIYYAEMCSHCVTFQSYTTSIISRYITSCKLQQHTEDSFTDNLILVKRLKFCQLWNIGCVRIDWAC